MLSAQCWSLRAPRCFCARLLEFLSIATRVSVGAAVGTIFARSLHHTSCWMGSGRVREHLDCFPQELIAMISGRIPPDVEKKIRMLMQTYHSNITSVLCQFPSQQVNRKRLRFNCTGETKNCVFSQRRKSCTGVASLNRSLRRLRDQFCVTVLAAVVADRADHRQPRGDADAPRRPRRLLPHDAGHRPARPEVRRRVSQPSSFCVRSEWQRPPRCLAHSDVCEFQWEQEHFVRFST